MQLSGPSVSTSSLSLLFFLATLHWPKGVADLGKFGISYLELLVMFEQKAGHRVTCERVFRPHLRACRPLIFFEQFPCQHWQRNSPKGVSSSTGCSGLWDTSPVVSPGLFPAGSFPQGWGQCGHDLASRPRERCDMSVIHAVVFFFSAARWGSYGAL